MKAIYELKTDNSQYAKEKNNEQRTAQIHLAKEGENNRGDWKMHKTLFMTGEYVSPAALIPNNRYRRFL